MTNASLRQVPDKQVTYAPGGWFPLPEWAPATATMGVRCPYCGATPGRMCRDPYSGRPTELLAHPSRTDVARAA